MKSTHIALILIICSILFRFSNNLCWNFTTLGGLALYCGAYIRPAYIGLPLIIFTRLITDYILGFYSSILFDYIAYCCIFLIGRFGSQRSALMLAVTTAFTFFLVSNFGVWYSESMYSKNLQGLIDCYIMGVPFAIGTICGDIGTTLIIFAMHRHFVGSTKICTQSSSSISMVH